MVATALLSDPTREQGLFVGFAHLFSVFYTLHSFPTYRDNNSPNFERVNRLNWTICEGTKKTDSVYLSIEVMADQQGENLLQYIPLYCIFLPKIYHHQQFSDKSPHPTTQALPCIYPGYLPAYRPR